MKMSAKSNQNGFSHVESLLILIIVLIIGFIGYYVYTTKQNTGKSLSANTSKAVPKTSGTSTKTKAQNVIKIPELGVELINVPESIKDMTFEISKPGTDQKYTAAALFTTPSLAKLDSRCSIGGLDNFPGTYNNGTGDYPFATFAKQFDSFWIASTHSSVPCGEIDTPSFILQTEQIQAYSQLVKTGSNIQILR